MSGAETKREPCPFCRTMVTMERSGGGPGGGTEIWFVTCKSVRCQSAGLKMIHTIETPKLDRRHHEENKQR
jgi:hypothetical protein